MLPAKDVRIVLPFLVRRFLKERELEYLKEITVEQYGRARANYNNIDEESITLLRLSYYELLEIDEKLFLLEKEERARRKTRTHVLTNHLGEPWKEDLEEEN